VNIVLTLDRSIPTPLHYQVQLQVRDAIRTGRLPVGAMLPPEPELAAQAGVSRYTLRQAIDALVREGLLHRRRGRGTFVSEPPLAQELGRFYSFAHDLAEQGLHPTSRVLRVARRAPPPDVRDILRLSDRERVVEVVRLRLLDGEPVIFETSVLPATRVPGLTRGDVATGSLYDLLAQRYGLRVTHADEELRAVVLDEGTAAALDVAAGSAAFHVERRTFAGEIPIELRRSLIRADRYRFRVRLPTARLTGG
jgi:GntR family transcriptional regulator